MRGPIGYFSSSYVEARQKFLDTCTSVGAPVTHYLNPNGVGPHNEDLVTDVACIGPSNAELLYIVASATHGVEGFLGSGCQVGFLRERLFEERPRNSSILFVHAMNPFGFAHVRRVNEDNVDLNRNFVNHTEPYPIKAEYELVHPFLVPEEWDGPSRASADGKISSLIETHGLAWYQSAVSSGQYLHSDGVFYGGQVPVWSNQNWRKILAKFAPGRLRIGFLDLHTGLGPYGYGEPMFLSWPDMIQYERARQWYGDDVTAPEAGDSTSAAVQGVVAASFKDVDVNAEITAIALEFGTVPVLEVLDAVRADNWLYVHGNPLSSMGKTIKRQIRDAFYCDEDDWKHLVWDRSVDIFRKGLSGLGG